MIFNKIFNEDCRETMARMPDNSIDSIVTDPPYEYGFMGKSWDASGIAYNVELWKECLRVLKPGAYLLAFGGTRTSHRMVCAIEDAGFEIRDSILWLYGSGFPKNLNISKQIDKEAGVKGRKIITGKPVKRMIPGNDQNKTGSYIKDNGREYQPGKEIPATETAKTYEGWGTALKPAHEPICVARKPIAEKTVAKNVLKYGTGGINIDECRIDFKSKEDFDSATFGRGTDTIGCNYVGTTHSTGQVNIKANPDGRFPANIILDEFTGKILNQAAPDTGAFAPVKKGQKRKIKNTYGKFADSGDDGDSFYDDKGGASRFFYIAKANPRERNAGLKQFKKDKQNIHATVKPVKLIQYLQKLVTPPGGITYDPFGGSGTSVPAAQNNGFKWIMSELIKEHYDIAVKRIYHNGGLWL